MIRGLKARIISVVVAVAVVFAYTPMLALDRTESETTASGMAAVAADSNEGNYNFGDAPSPQDVTDALKTFTEAMEKFVSDTKDLSKLASFMERFGGVAGTLSGCIAILQMMGIIEDPTAKALADILSEVKDIQTELKDMRDVLIEIAKKLDDLSADQKEMDRQNNARSLLSFWRTFNDTYRNPLDKYIKEYETYIDNGTKAWWESYSHDGIRLLYTKIEGKLQATYSKNNYASGFPDKADNGEAIEKSACIGIPAECIPDTKAVPFDIDNYRDKFAELFTAAIKKAADENKLDASEEFYNEWKALDDKAKEKKAGEYANDALSTLIYHISCEEMTKNNTWVADVSEAYKKYCENILMVDSGVDALINVQYLTHGFEGEVKKDVEKICDAMVAAAGFYGSFALSCAGQDSMSRKTNKEELQAAWVGTIKHLNEKKKQALTGNDNFCYVAGSAIEFKKMYNYATAKMVYSKPINSSMRDRTFESYDYTKWKIVDENEKDASVPAIMRTDRSIVLYHQYLRQKEKDQSYAAFLAKNGLSVDKDFSGKITTSYQGQKDFALSDGVPMIAKQIIGDYFEMKKDYYINSGNSSKVEKDCFVFHDKTVHDYMDSKTGATEDSAICAAKAAYKENHWYWVVDEMHVFTIDWDDWTLHYDRDRHNGSYKYTDHYTFKVPIYLLAYKNVDIDDKPDTSPLKSFEQCYIMSEKKKAEIKKVSVKADWSKENIDNIIGLDKYDKSIDKGVKEEIDKAVSEAKDKGIKVSLTKGEKAKLVSRMKNVIRKLNTELNRNKVTGYKDVFGIDGDEEAEMKLAKQVLPSAYLDENGEPAVTYDNMNTKARYEPGAMIHFTKKDGKAEAVINPAFNIDPLLVIWDDEAGVFKSFDVSDESMTKLGLRMNVRIPASFTDKNRVKVIHYDDIDSKKEVEKVSTSVKGIGKNKYVQLDVKQCSPFEFADEASSDNPKTDDMVNMTCGVIMMILSGAVLAAMFVRRRESI